MDNKHPIQYTQAYLEQYWQGKLSPAEMHAIEKAALQDPFLADALEGYRLTHQNNANNILHNIQENIKATHSNTITDNHSSLTSFNTIQAYLNGNLTAAQQHAVEKKALQDNFLTDAIEGYQQTNFTKAKAYLENIEKLIWQQQQKAKVVPLVQKQKSWLRIAAAIILMVGAGSTVWYINNKNRVTENPIAQNQPTVLQQDKTSTPTNTPNNTLAAAETVNGATNNSATKQSTTPTIPNITHKETVAALPQQTNPLTNVKAEEVAIQKTVTGRATMFSNSKEEQTFNTDAATQKKSINGKVINEQGEGVQATITVNNENNTPQNIVTDKAGNFVINTTKDTLATAQIQSNGYVKEKANLQSGIQNNITLKREQSAAIATDAAVEVVHYNSKKQTATQKADTFYTANAQPIIGWQAFIKYLETEEAITDSLWLASTFSKDVVVVEFNINNNGNPVNVITKGNNKQHSKKAARLIKNGPKWVVPANEANKKVKLALKVQ